jgi:tRNA(Ile)-lysidine synthase
MALAALYATARQSDTALPNAHGFIVDHRVRPESTEEAEWVAEQLRQKCTATIPQAQTQADS